MKIEVSLSVDNVSASILIDDDDCVVFPGEDHSVMIDEAIERLGKMVRAQITDHPVTAPA